MRSTSRRWVRKNEPHERIALPCGSYCFCAADANFVAKISNPMQLAFGGLHPGGMIGNSPTLQRWGEARSANESRRDGRILPSTSAVPSGLSRRWHPDPTLKRWAILGCPSGTKTGAPKRSAKVSGIRFLIPGRPQFRTACRIKIGDTVPPRRDNSALFPLRFCGAGLFMVLTSGGALDKAGFRADIGRA